jgi:hypothetical protein
METFRYQPEDLETIKSCPVSPKWRSKVKVKIKDNVTNAAAQDLTAEEEEEACIYSDGSSQNGSIGGAVALHIQSQDT